MRRNTDKAHRIWQMIYRAGRDGIPAFVVRQQMGITQGNLDGALAGMERYGMVVCEDDNVLYAYAHFDEPEQDWKAVKNFDYYNKYR